MNGSQHKTIPKILWVDDEEFVLNTVKRLLRTQNYEIKTTLSPREALELVQKEDFSIVVSDQRMPEMTGLEFLSHVKKISPLSTRLLVTGFSETELMQEAVNSAGIFGFVTKPWKDEDLLVDLQRASQHSMSLRSHLDLVKKVSEQNRQLSVMTSNLESLIEDRTRELTKSKSAAVDRQERVKSLLRFIRDLNSCLSVEQFFDLCHKEFRRMEGVGDPILVYHEEHHTVILGVSVKKTIRKIVEGKADLPNRIRWDHASDSQWLANHLGIPISKVITLPLSEGAAFYIRHTIDPLAFTDILERLSQRVQPMGLTIDRLRLSEGLLRASREWENTFDAILDPVAIRDDEGFVVRSNNSYEKQIRPSLHNLSSLREGEMHFKDRLYEVHCYPLKTYEQSEKKYDFIYMKDVTESRKLYESFLQGEKMSALGRLAGHIAHELNNPLTGIYSLCEILVDEVRPEHKEDIEEIAKSAKRSQEIIRDLLTFTDTNLHEDLELVNLNEVVQKTIPLLKTMLRQHELVLNLSETPPLLKGKKSLLQQVTFNLLHNACEAMKTRGIITISTAVSKKQAQLVVADTGPGIPETIQNRIFDAFYTTKAEGQGTGLGLSLSKNIVERLEGKIALKSKVGQGAEFILSFPLYKGSLNENVDC